jgi:threonine dehydrogenase-like Zn-dependent dehydrogenase
VRAAVLHGPGHLSVDDVDDPRLLEPTDAIVRVVVAGVCGTDLRGYAGLPGPANGPRCGHEFVGVVAEVGAAVTTLRVGATVVAPFVFADGTCAACRRGLSTSCRSGGMFGVAGDGGQAEAVRVPFADATLVPLPVDEHDERLPAFLTLTDVMATGQHAVHTARVTTGTSVAVVGDGPVGLCTVLAARRAGASRIVLLGRHEARTRIGTGFGADTVVASRGEEAVADVLDSTGGAGVDVVVDCVGEAASTATALGVCRDGGTLSVVGGVHAGIDLLACFLRNITITGGLTPARGYLEALVDDVLAGRLDPSPVFDLSVPLADVAAGYEAMRAREATKVLVRLS